MDHDVPVLIAGGGLVGLSLALFLGDHGVPALLVERHPGTSRLPRGRGLNLRTMEVLRAAGIEAALRAAPPSVLRDYPEIARAETLDGPELFRDVRPAPDSYAELSPTTPIMIDQNVVEPVLREHAERNGGDLRFLTELRSFEQDEDGVTATLLDRAKEEEYAVRARYLVAADGHRSPVRTALGIGTGDTGSITRYVSIPFEADLSGPLRGRPLALCYLDRPVPKTVLTRLDGPTRWVLMVPDDDTDGGLSTNQCHALIAEAIGRSDVPVTVLRDGPEPLETWELTSWVADRFRDGRVLLAGDAVHVTPPAGGLGGNTGVQDAHNLAWKLAAVVRGHAGPGLLDSYEEERRAVAQLTCEFSLTKQMSRVAGQGERAPGTGDPLAVSLGYRYRSGAVADEEPGERPAPSRVFRGRPGSRAPHLPLSRAGVSLSTLDLYRRNFVLLTGPGGERWADAGRRVRVPAGLDVYRIGPDLRDTTGRWADAHGVTDAGAVLVRPDGYVCWRARGEAPAGAVGVLAGSLRRVLAAPGAAEAH